MQQTRPTVFTQLNTVSSQQVSAPSLTPPPQGMRHPLNSAATWAKVGPTNPRWTQPLKWGSPSLYLALTGQHESDSILVQRNSEKGGFLLLTGPYTQWLINQSIYQFIDHSSFCVILFCNPSMLSRTET